MALPYKNCSLSGLPLRVYSPVGTSFMNALRSAHGAYPDGVQAFFRNARFANGTRPKIVVASKYTDTQAEDRPHRIGDPTRRRTHFNQICGRYRGRDSSVHIYEFRLITNPDAPLSLMDEFDARGPERDPYNNVWLPTTVPLVYHHEGGHCISSFFGKLGRRFSDYARSWDQDAEAIQRGPKKLQRVWQSYIHNADRGREETAADLWAEFSGSRKAIRPVSAAFPRSREWLFGFFERFTACAETDPAFEDIEGFTHSF